MKSLSEYINEAQFMSMRFTYKELFDSKLYEPSKDYSNDIVELADALMKLKGTPFDVELDGIDKADNSYIKIIAKPNLHNPNPTNTLIEAVEWVCNHLETKCGGKAKHGRANYKKFAEKHFD